MLPWCCCNCLNLDLRTGAGKLWGGEGEKVAFWMLLQEFCPAQYQRTKDTKAAWRSIVKKLRDEQHTLTLQDKEGNSRVVVVNMGPSMKVHSAACF